MDLPAGLLSEFAKITDNSTTKTETTVYGTTVKEGDTMYVKLDGSDLLTPISTTADVKENERVMVLIKNHTAIITGNTSSPAARTEDVQEIGGSVANLEERANSGELDGAVLRIDSSRGTVFKNNAVSTVLSAVIFKGPKTIRDIIALREVFGDTAYLEWSCLKMGESTYTTILSTDDRIGDDGFTLTLTPNDVDTKVTFMCNLITE